MTFGLMSDTDDFTIPGCDGEAAVATNGVKIPANAKTPVATSRAANDFEVAEGLAATVEEIELLNSRDSNGEGVRTPCNETPSAGRAK